MGVIIGNMALGRLVSIISLIMGISALWIQGSHIGWIFIIMGSFFYLLSYWNPDDNDEFTNLAGAEPK